MRCLIKTMSLGVIFVAALVGCGGSTEQTGGTTTGTGGSSSSGTGGTTTATGGGTGGAPAVDGPVQPTSGPYQPLVINATWTYHVDDKGTKYDKVNKIETLEDMGGMKPGVMAFRQRSTLPAEVQLT